jgi:hypothetical protein
MPDSVFAGSTSLSLFVAGEYRVSVFHFKLLDLALLLAMQVILVLWGTPASLPAGLAQLACIFALLAGMMALLLLVRPHRHEDRWNLVVEIYIMLLAALQATVNFVNALARRAEAAAAASSSGAAASASDAASTSDDADAASYSAGLRATVVVLAYCCLVASMGLFVVILFAFVASLWAAAEEATAARMAQRLLAPRGGRTRAEPARSALAGRRAAARAGQ